MSAKAGVISTRNFATKAVMNKAGVVCLRAVALVVCCVLCEAGAFSQSASSAAPATTTTAAKKAVPTKVISPDEAKEQLKLKYPPDYPSDAKNAHIEGAVVLRTLIATDGSVKSVRLVSGPPQLVQAAEDSVKQWKYQPYLVNGRAIPVATQVTVDFKLDDPPPAPEKPKATVLECNLPAAPTEEAPFKMILTRKSTGETEDKSSHYPGGYFQQPLTFTFRSDDPQWQHDDSFYWVTAIGTDQDSYMFTVTVPPVVSPYSANWPDKNYRATVTISRTNMAVNQTIQAGGEVTVLSNYRGFMNGMIQRTGQCEVYAPKF
jgi:TonB family protein